MNQSAGRKQPAKETVKGLLIYTWLKCLRARLKLKLGRSWWEPGRKEIQEQRAELNPWGALGSQERGGAEVVEATNQHWKTWVIKHNMLIRQESGRRSGTNGTKWLWVLANSLWQTGNQKGLDCSVGCSWKHRHWLHTGVFTSAIKHRQMEAGEGHDSLSFESASAWHKLFECSSFRQLRTRSLSWKIF